jgi:cyanophycin synthetase
MIAHIVKGLGHKVGMTTTDGIYIDGRLVKQADASGPRSARMVLQNPRVDFAVFEVARGGILREGLGYSANDVAVVLNVTGDHLGLKEVNSLRQLAAIKRVVVEAVPRSGTAVLNADDELVAEMRTHCSGSVIYFSMRDNNPLIDRWVRRGRKAFVIEKQPGGGEMMVLREGRRSTQIAWVHLIPATFDGRARANVQNALAAAAAAHAAGAHLHDIRQGLRSFHPSFHEAPGRLNMFELHGIKVIVDYAHNPAGLQMAGDFVERLTAPGVNGPGPEPGRRIAVIATPGDRRDEDMRELGRVAARVFDILIVREDANPRGRQRGEIARHVMEGVKATEDSRVETAEIIIDERPAIDAALSRARPGDVVLLCVDKPADTWRDLEARRAVPVTPAN